MIKKVYRVISVSGQVERTLYEGNPFDRKDGDIDWAEWKAAEKARDEYYISLRNSGYDCMNDGRYFHRGKGIDAGRIEVVKCSKI